MLRAWKTLDPALTARDKEKEKKEKKEKEEEKKEEKEEEKLGSKLKRGTVARGGSKHCAISFGGNVGDHMARRFRGRRLRVHDQASSQPA